MTQAEIVTQTLKHARARGLTRHEASIAVKFLCNEKMPGLLRHYPKTIRLFVAEQREFFEREEKRNNLYERTTH
jgi:hypothetical protein